MEQSVLNAVSPFEGKLHWVGQPTAGQSQSTGNPWKRVDFTICYVDSQLQNRYVTFSLSGVEKVDRLLQIPLGSVIRVTWRPSGNEYQGKWYPKVEALGIFYQQAQAAPQAPQYPQYPQQQAGYAQPQYQQPQQAPAPQYPPQNQSYQPGAGFYPPAQRDDDMPMF